MYTLVIGIIYFYVVIKGINLPALDSNGKNYCDCVLCVCPWDAVLMDYFHCPVGYSDPYVDIMLMPERRFKIKSMKTDFKSKDVNPTYYKEFKMYVNV